MRSFRLALAVAVAAVLCATEGSAYAQDHEKCYKIKDPAKLKGTLDLTTPQFGLEAGCMLGPAKYFCAPASKSNVAVIDKTTKLPLTPLPLYAPPAPVDRICYKVKCQIPLAQPTPYPSDQNVTDQFGNRTLTKFKASYMCTPAVKGTGYCGDGIINGTEACDGAALGTCTVGCQPDCTCTCETACCYVENLANPPDAECFEYSGTPAQVAAFGANCSGGGVGVPGSLPAGSMANSTLPGKCVAGPLFGFPCIAGPPGFGNLHVIPSDSTCP
jgi:hypothetical protein